ncbi:MAG: hypothetical protein ACRDEB_05630 [Chitinophagaceae bacterium]
MKKFLAITVIAASLVACGNKAEKKVEEVKDSATNVMNEVKDSATNLMNEVKDSATNMINKAVDSVKPKM